jgi:hypothetical protein
MTVGDFRKITSDLPDDFRITLCISPDLAPSWITGFAVKLERRDAPTLMVKTGVLDMRPRVIITIEPDEPREESWSTPGGEI